MKKEVISRYQVMVYNTGEIEFYPIVEDGDLTNCSSSIRQILGIIEFVLQYRLDNPNNHFHFAVVSAVNHVAYVERVTQSTVHAKITRKLGLSMQDFKKQLESCIENKAPDNDVFVQTLFNACVNRTKQEDESGVKKIIEKIRNL